MAGKELKSHINVDDPPAKKRKKKVSQESAAARRLKRFNELIFGDDHPESEISSGGKSEIVKQTAKAESHTVFEEGGTDKPKHCCPVEIT